MTQILRQSTQIIVRIGPAVAVADGFTPVTTLDLSTADEAELLKANTTTTTSIAAATLAAITGCDGWYGLTLTTSLTDTVGPLDVMVNDDSLMLPIFARFQVIEEAAYDVMYAASAPGAASPTNITAGTITTATNVTTVNGLAANVITAAATAADFGTEVANAVWDTDATAHQTGGTFGQAIGDPAADTNTIYGAVVTGAAGATVAADIIAIKAETASILTDTAEIGAAGAGLTNINLPNQTMDIVGNITGNLSGSVGSVTGLTTATIADQVWDELQADHVGVGSFGLIASEIADILVDTAEIGAAGAGLTAIDLPDQTMNITGNITGNLSGSVGSVTGAVGSVTGAVGSVTGLTASDVGAIKTKTDSLTFTVAGKVDSNITHVIADPVQASSAKTTNWGGT